MDVPLVQGRTQPFLLSKAKLGIFGQAGAFGQTRQPQVTNLGDAVKISLSSDKSSTEKVAGQEAAPTPTPLGFAERALKRLGDVAKRIGELDKVISGAENGESVKSAAQQELGELASEYDRILKSPDIKRLGEVITGVQNTLASGGSPETLSKILQSESVLLGKHFLDLVANGASANIGRVGSSLESLGAITSADLLATPSLAASISSTVEDALKAFDGPEHKEVAAVEQKTSEATNAIITPETQETQFVTSGNVALSLHGYTSKGLLTAAFSGADLDPKEISQLVIQLPKDEKEKDKTKEEANPFQADEAPVTL